MFKQLYSKSFAKIGEAIESELVRFSFPSNVINLSFIGTLLLFKSYKLVFLQRMQNYGLQFTLITEFLLSLGSLNFCNTAFNDFSLW